MFKPPRLTVRVRRFFAATFAACTVAAVTLTAQFAVFNEGFEGEIWELIATLDLPDIVDEGGEPVPFSNWASGIAWVDGELFVADNYSSVITKFDENLQLVDLPAAKWYGAAGSPTFGWAPNEAIPAEVVVDGGPKQKALLVTDFMRSRVFAFWPNGEHVFTIEIPEDSSDPAYSTGLNGVALSVGGHFQIDNASGAIPTLQVVGKLAVAWPEYFDIGAGGALIYENPIFVFNGATGQFDAGDPDFVLTGGAGETGDVTVPAVKAVTGVSFDTAGNFYMVDSWTGRLHGYDSGFNHQFVFGTPDETGETTLEFQEAYGMTLWPSAAGDRLLITLPLKNQAVVYAPSPRGGVPTTIEYLFKLDGLGAVDGLPHSSAFDPKHGRVAVSDSGDNSVKVFQTPVLAVFDLQLKDSSGQPAASVCGGDNYFVSFSITVPEGRSAVQLVSPLLLVNGVPTLVTPSPGDSSYGAADVGPLAPRDVISYTYSFTAPNTGLPQALLFTATASGTTTSVGGNGESAAVAAIFEKLAELPVVDCGSGNQAPTVDAVVPIAAQPTGWTQITPLPVPVSFPVTLNAADLDGTISRITYAATGTNSIPSTTVTGVSSLPVTLVQPGVTTLTYQAFDDDLMPSATGTLVVRLDNSLPSICLNIPAPFAQKTPAEWWWNNTVTIPVLLTDNQDPSPQLIAPIPVEYAGGNLVFVNEGAAQFATLIAQDHAGHQRVQPSNTTLDVCGPGKIGRMVNIDRTAPGVTEDADETVVHASSLTVTISGADGLSGVRYIEYSVNNAPFVRVEASSVPVLLSSSASLAFRSIDWAGNASTTATRTYIVNPPVALADQYQTDEDTVLAIASPGVLVNDSAAPSMPLTASLVSAPSHGAVALAANGSFVYTPLPDYSGPDSFTYRGHDGMTYGDPATVTITVRPVNDPPLASNDLANTAHNTPVIIAVLANDLSGDAGDSLAIQSIVNGAGGHAAANPNGTITFTPAPGFEGAATFTYTVADQGGLTSTASVTVGVAPANTAPVCSAAFVSADLWPPNHKQVYVSIGGVTDADNQPVTIGFTSILQDEPTDSAGQGKTMQDGGIEQNGARAWVRSERSGTPRAPGDGRVYLIEFTASDSLGASCSGTVRLDVPHDQRGTPAVLSPGRWNSITGLPVLP